MNTVAKGAQVSSYSADAPVCFSVGFDGQVNLRETLFMSFVL
jgi:hypothetical protein